MNILVALAYLLIYMYITQSTLPILLTGTCQTLTFHLSGLHPIFRNGLLLLPFILLVRLGATLLSAYPKDLFLDLFSIFCLLQTLALFSHLGPSQVILMPMTFNPTNIAQHLRQLLQSEICPRPLMLSMPGCHLIACC